MRIRFGKFIVYQPRNKELNDYVMVIIIIIILCQILWDKT